MTQNKTNKVSNVPPLRFPEFSGEWEKQGFADNLLRLENGVNYDTNETEGLPLSRIETISTCSINYEKVGYCNSKNIDHYKMEYGDILFSHINSMSHIGKTAYYYAERPLYHGMNLLLFRCNSRLNSLFFYHLLNTPRFLRTCQVYAKQAVNQASISTSDIKKIQIHIPNIHEQNKIATFISLIDQRIETQIRVIEDLQTLKKAIIERSYNVAGEVHKIGELIEQADQFEDRTVASDDTSNYKVVSTNDFAYNPARINVGSIARLRDRTNGIVSPMYVCFRTKDKLLPEYMEHFFDTTYFKHEMFKRLEGSVRLCLSYEGLCNISMSIPSIEEQKKLSNRLSAIEQKIQIESKILEAYKMQKSYLLQQMFI